MPEKRTVEKAKTALRQGKRPTTAAGEFVREEIEHVRHGKHGARSSKQAVAIGLSKARRAGVPLPPPRAGTTSERTRRSAARASEVGQGKAAARPSSSKRRKASRRALGNEPKTTTSKQALSRHAKQTATRPRKRSKAASGK
jgi:hypothetical protein